MLTSERIRFILKAAFGCSLRYFPAESSREFLKAKRGGLFILFSLKLTSNCCELGQEQRWLLRNRKKFTWFQVHERQISLVAVAAASLS